MHDARTLTSDLVVGSTAGYGATVAMEHFNSFVYEHVEGEAARRREQELRAAMPTVLMARNLNDRLGGRLPEQRVDKLGEWMHFGFGVAWGPIYALLRRRTGITPIKLGLGLGAFVSLAFAEGLTAAAGFSPPTGRSRGRRTPGPSPRTSFSDSHSQAWSRAAGGPYRHTRGSGADGACFA